MNDKSYIPLIVAASIIGGLTLIFLYNRFTSDDEDDK